MTHITTLYGMEKYDSLTLSVHLDIERENWWLLKSIISKS